MSFVDFLYNKNIVNQDLYELALEQKSLADSYISDILISTGDYSEEDIARLKSEYFGLDYTDLIDLEQIDNIDYKELESSEILPFKVSQNCLHIATSDPNNNASKNILNYVLSFSEQNKSNKIVYHIASKEKIKSKFKELNQEKSVTVNKILYDALKNSASDIHVTPFEKTLKIQFRIDGELVDYKILDIQQFAILKNSIKVMAKLDISECRRPQSGNFQKDRIDFRVSTHPTMHGENLVIRILNKDKDLISIDKLGFNQEQVSYLKQICNNPNGLIIFCGPTGSGKTTSIYSLIETMDKKSRNIMTLEDPIEYKISHVKQTEILPGVINFADGIKSILRQDPDVILIGEIRDEESAKMAIRASMTGHLVFTTIHANDSFGAIFRLKEFNILNSLIAENLVAIISQRLVKKANGAGRIVVSEILKIDSSITNLIMNNADKLTIKNQALSSGFKSIYDDYLEKLKENIISESTL